MPLALSFILFAILGAVYGAILYGLQPPIIGDLPQGNDDIDASYIIISSEYIRMSERTCSSGIAPSVLILYPLSVFALNCAQSKIPLTIVLLLIYAIFAFLIHRLVMKKYFPRFEVCHSNRYELEFWRISEFLLVSMKRILLSAAAYIVYFILLWVCYAVVLWL